MKRAALRYAEILEKGAWVSHQEQDEIAKLLRKLVENKDWVGLDNSDLQYQTPHDVITMRYAEALLKAKNT